MIRFLVLIGIVGAGNVIAAEGSRILSDDATDDLRVLAGLAPPLRHASINRISVANTPTFDQELEFTAGLSPRAGLRYLHGTWLTPEFGWKYGPDFLLERSTGTARDRDTVNPEAGERDIVFTSQSVGLAFGPTIRMDIDSLEVPADLLEFELLIGGGPARMRVSDDRLLSSFAFGTRYGASLGMVITTFDRLQFGFEGGAEFLSTKRLHWGNTEDSTITAFGISGGIQVGRRW